ncbi:effector binding domain-containing protein [Viridibacillus sp. FSL E2-0187]|uniref:GyrI-like domain-containing protein n=1 Tax=Viridibacillus sp. FSL E2-0187 TaxID=2921362 RepID=UPI0030FA539A
MHTAINEKQIYGKSVRTNNQNTEEIIKLWEEFLRLNLTGEIYAVYSNYSRDFTGDYDLHIGTEEPNTNDVSTIIPEDNYLAIEVDNMDPKGVFKAWEKIWKSDIDRAYNTDFEHYCEDGSIKIYLSVNL